MIDNWELAKYGNKWAVFSRVSRTFSYIGEGEHYETISKECLALVED